MIQVINRAFDILELLAVDSENPMSLNDISKELGLNAGTCANILKTMIDRKYIEKVEGKKKGYQLGTKLYYITRNEEGYRKDLIKVAKGELELLTKKINENSILTVLDGENRIALLRIASNHGVQATTSIERRAYETTSGRLLIAMLPAEVQEKFIDKYGPPDAHTWSEAGNLKKLKKTLEKIKEEKHTVQTTSGDMIGFAVPIYLSDKVIASLGIYMPAFRFKENEKEQILSLMHKAASKISHTLKA